VSADVTIDRRKSINVRIKCTIKAASGANAKMDKGETSDSIREPAAN
jgi:hypothetical protein